jgi:hypothetical protein
VKLFSLSKVTNSKDIKHTKKNVETQCTNFSLLKNSNINKFDKKFGRIDWCTN